MQSDAEAHYRAAAALAPFDPHALRRWGRLKLELGAPARRTATPRVTCRVLEVTASTRARAL